MKKMALLFPTFCRAKEGEKLCGRQAVLLFRTGPKKGIPFCFHHSKVMVDWPESEVRKQLFHVEQFELPFEVSSEEIPGNLANPGTRVPQP